METIRYLRTIAQTELRAEHFRIELSVNDQFEPYQLYCLLSDEKGLSIAKMQDLLRMNYDQCNQLLTLLGPQGYISFQSMVLPQTDTYLREQVQYRYTKRIDNDGRVRYKIQKNGPSDKVKQQFISLMQQLLKKREDITQARRTTGVDAKSAFQQLDRNKIGFLRFDNFDDLSREVDSFMPPEEIVALFRIADIDRDRRLTYSEFQLLFDDNDKAFLYTNNKGVLASEPTLIETVKKQVDHQQIGSLIKPSYQQYEQSTHKKTITNNPEAPETYSKYKEVKISSFNVDEQQQYSDQTPSFLNKHASPYSKTAKSRQEEANLVAKWANKPESNVVESLQSHNLSELLKEQIIMEKQLADIKSNAIMEPEYTIDNLWTFFNVRKATVISKAQFTSTINELGVRFIAEDLDNLFAQFDSSGQGLQLKQEDLSRLLMPQVPDFNLLINSRQFFNGKISEITKGILCDLIESHLWVQSKKQQLIKSFTSSPNFSLERVFALICDQSLEGLVNRHSLQAYLWKSGIFISHVEALSVIAIYDINKDGNVTIEEFEKTLESVYA